MDKEPDRGNMVLQFFGERERFANESAYSLSERAVEALERLSAFTIAVMPIAEDNGLVGSP